MATYSLRSCEYCGNSFRPLSSRMKHCGHDCRFRSIAARFEGVQGCWDWPFTPMRGTGYGLFTVTRNGEKSFWETAHRLSYMTFVGPIPEGLFVLHRCDNRMCFNPAHLHVGTHQQNVADMVAKRRHAMHDPSRVTEIVDKVIATKFARYGIGRRWMLDLAARDAAAQDSRSKDSALASQLDRR